MHVVFSSGTQQCIAGRIIDFSTEMISLLYGRQSHYNNDAPYPNIGQYFCPSTSFVVTFYNPNIVSFYIICTVEGESLCLKINELVENVIS
jgi:hypothetical protein